MRSPRPRPRRCRRPRGSWRPRGRRGDARRPRGPAGRAASAWSRRARTGSWYGGTPSAGLQVLRDVDDADPVEEQPPAEGIDPRLGRVARLDRRPVGSPEGLERGGGRRPAPPRAPEGPGLVLPQAPPPPPGAGG